MTIANNAVEATETVDMTVEPVRDSVARDIHALLETIGDSYIKVGGLLTEARADFENQKDFLEWAESEFSIKKAQCYNLMNVARVFGADSRFTGVSMRVMLALIPLADEADVMEKAAALAEAGTLTTTAVNELLGKPKAPIKLVQSDAAKDDPMAQFEGQVALAEERATKLHVTKEEMRDAADSAGEAIISAAQGVAEGANLDEWKEPAGMQVTTMQALLDQNKRLSEQLDAAMARIAEMTSTRETKKATAPMLPQFKSKCLYARLGLSAEQATSKSAISKARRELVKIGYGEGHEAWAAISEAVEKLSVSAE